MTTPRRRRPPEDFSPALRAVVSWIAAKKGAAELLRVAQEINLVLQGEQDGSQ